MMHLPKKRPRKKKRKTTTTTTTTTASKCTRNRTRSSSEAKSWTRSKTKRSPAETARRRLCLRPANKSFTPRKGGKTNRRDVKRVNERRKRGLAKINRSATRTNEASAREERIANFRTGRNRRTAVSAAAAAALQCATRTKEASAREVIRASFRTKKVEVMVVRDRRREVIVEASESALHF